MGIILLLISLVLYFTKWKLVSILFFLNFCFNFFYLIPDSILIIKAADLALIYTLCLTFVNSLTIKNYFYIDSVSKWIFYFVIFLFISSLFSMFFLNFSIKTVFQGSRDFYLILSYFFLIRLNEKTIKNSIKYIIIITLITSVLYILQLFFQKAILVHFTDTLIIDKTTGFPRFYNFPIFSILTLFIILFHPKISKNLQVIAISILIFALLLSLSRFMIVSTLILILLGFVIKNKIKGIILFFPLIILLTIPFYDIILIRFQDGGTTNDMQMLLSGNFNNFDMVYNNDATMTYRIAWCIERINYLINNGLGSVLFGIGFIGDMDPLVHKIFNFHLGLPNKETGLLNQIKTPDIGYGNIIARLGFLGGFIWIKIWTTISKKIYKKRENALFFSSFIFAISIFFISFSGNSISEPSSFIYFFLILSLFKYNEKNFNNNSLL